MNQENFDYLKNQVIYSGFGESLENELKDKINQQSPKFDIKHAHEFGKDQTESTLHFRKSDSTDRYFFNSYDLALKPEKSDEPLSQTFYMGKANNYTLKEAYNLMSGRAVYKELKKMEKTGEGENIRYKPTDEKYNAWVQLDFKDTDANGNYKFKQFHENFGFNLEEALNKLPIKELQNEKDKQELIKSLEKGNRQFVTYVHEGKVENRYIQANPQFKSIAIYDGSMKRIRQDQKEGTEPTVKQDIKKKQDAKAAQNETNSDQKKTKKRGQGVS